MRLIPNKRISLFFNQVAQTRPDWSKLEAIIKKKKRKHIEISLEARKLIELAVEKYLLDIVDFDKMIKERRNTILKGDLKINTNEVDGDGA